MQQLVKFYVWNIDVRKIHNINFSDMLRFADWDLTDFIKFHFHLQVQVIPVRFFGWFTLKMELLRSLETTLVIEQSKQLHIPDDSEIS